jgi:hypothetical protein
MLPRQPGSAREQFEILQSTAKKVSRLPLWVKKHTQFGGYVFMVGLDFELLKTG